MMPSTHVVRVVLGLSEGEPAWWCVKLTKTAWERYRKDIGRDSMDLSQYGRVLRSGWGEWPPENIIKSLEIEYGVKLKNPA